MKFTPTVILNTGCQFKFYPLVCIEGDKDHFPLAQPEYCTANQNVKNPFKLFEEKIKNDANKEAQRERIKEELEARTRQDSPYSVWRFVDDNCSFVKMRYTTKKIVTKIKDACVVSCFGGIEFAIETNKDDGTNKRGVFYKNFPIAADDPDYVKYINNGSDTIKQHSVYNGYANNTWSDSFKIKICETDIFGFGDKCIALELKIGFRNPRNNGNPDTVDLVCDFGNTRTIALLLEETSRISEIPDKCEPVTLKESSDIMATEESLSDVSNGIVNSWFVLHHTVFDTDNSNPDLLEEYLEGKYMPSSGGWGFFNRGKKFCVTAKELRIPQMFVQSAPIVLGDKAEELMNDAWVKGIIDRGANLEQSSPKRYYWDNQQVRADWNMIPRLRGGGIQLAPPALRAEILRYISESGKYVDPENVDCARRPDMNPATPRYPRASTFVWMLVYILEKAWSQINTKGGVHTFRLKKLRNVIVTYPSGWTKDQVNEYRKRCQEAVDIFQKMNFPKAQQNVKLIMDLDEAVASQIPYVFSEIHGFNDNAEAWLEIVGKTRMGAQSVRIMNFDIGGGTTDVSVVEYTNDRNIGFPNLTPALVYKNGVKFGGDEILRKIILHIVLKSISSQVANQDSSSDRLYTDLYNIFTTPTNAGDAIKRKRILRLCLIPFAIKILSDLSSGVATGGVANVNLGDTEITDAQWNEAENFFANKHILGFPGTNALYSYSPKEVNELIQNEFANLMKTCSAVAAQHDIDIFFMSGKTSELPCVIQLAQRVISLPNNRIIGAKNYRVGDWYPFKSKNGMIDDAKSVTAVGAALYTLLSSGVVNGWRINKPIGKYHLNTEWGRITGQANIYTRMFANADDDTIQCASGLLIGKKMSPDAEADPVYLLKRKDGNPHAPLLNVTFRKKVENISSDMPDSNDAIVDTREFIELVSVIDNGRDITSEFELIVCQENPDANEFWQDSGLLA